MTASALHGIPLALIGAKALYLTAAFIFARSFRQQRPSCG